MLCLHTIAHRIVVEVGIELDLLTEIPKVI